MNVKLLQKRGKVEDRDFQSQLQTAIRSIIGNLSATATFSSFTKEGWVTLSVTGEDTEVVTELLSQNLGTISEDASSGVLHGNYRGIVENLSASGLEVDVGIERPRPALVSVKLSSLQAQLADGQKISTRRIADCYCILPQTPISVRVTHSSLGEFEGWLADSQISHFSRWINSGLERIQVFNCLPTHLDFAIRKAQLERDIISSEQLSLTVQSMACKVGTNAIGLIPRVGSVLRKSELVPFIPRRIQKECRTWQANDV